MRAQWVMRMLAVLVLTAPCCASRAQQPGAGTSTAAASGGSTGKMVIFRTSPVVGIPSPTTEEREAARKERERKAEEARRQKLQKAEEAAKEKTRIAEELKQQKLQKVEAEARERERQGYERLEKAHVEEQARIWGAPATPEEAAQYEKVTAERLRYMEQQARRQPQPSCVIMPVMTDAQIERCRAP